MPVTRNQLETRRKLQKENTAILTQAILVLESLQESGSVPNRLEASVSNTIALLERRLGNVQNSNS